MFPDYFGSDFSAALPWMLMGFAAGVLLTVLLRWLRGVNGRSVELDAALSDLDASKTEEKRARASLLRLQTDNGHLEAAVADAERRAAGISTLQQEIAGLKKAEEDVRAHFTSANTDAAALRKQIDMYAAHSKTLEQRLQYYNAENTAISTAAETRARELEELRKNVADLKSSSGVQDLEIVRQRTEIDWFNARFASIAADASPARNSNADELERLKRELEALRTAAVPVPVAAPTSTSEPYGRDLAYYHDLASWSATEVGRLKKLLTETENGLAEKAARLAALETQLAAAQPQGKARSWAAKRHAFAPSRSSNGRVLGLEHRQIFGKPTRLKPKIETRAKRTAFNTKGKSGPAHSKSTPASAGRFGRVWLTGPSTAVKDATSAAGTDELAALRARVVSLSAEVEDYRRFRDALAAANRIVGGGA